ncbi:MAG: hypothetical protein WCR45_07770 [Bacteroidaceae bacterium]
MALFDDLVNNVSGTKSADFKINNPGTNATVQESNAIINTTIPTMEEHDPFSKGGGFFENAWKLANTGNEPETPDDAEKRAKREKARSNISGLADGLAAIGNAFAVSKGAKSVNQLPSFSDINRQRYDYAKDLRKKNEDSWKRGIYGARMQDVMSKQKARSAAEKAKMEAENIKYKREQDTIAQQNKEKEFEFKEKESQNKDDQWKQKFEADNKFKSSQLSIARQKANNTATKNGSTKLDRHATADGSSIVFPKDLEDDFYNYAYNQLAKAMEGKNVSIESIFNKNFGIASNVTPAAAKKAIVKEYMGNPEYKNVENETRAYADKMMVKYNQTPTIQVAGQVGVTETPGVNGPVKATKKSFDDAFGQFEEKGSPLKPKWGSF